MACTGPATSIASPTACRTYLAENLAKLDDWGGIHDYPHYAWGWAWAGNTPFRLWKRYTWLGGTRVPMIVHWPRGIDGRGEVRTQFAHAVDMLPTVLEACGIAAPDVVGGVPADADRRREPAGDVQRRRTRPSPRTSQYFEMLGSRSMVADGWKATTDHVSQGVSDEEELLEGSRDFRLDRWSLFKLDEDFSEAHDLADRHPEIVTRSRTSNGRKPPSATACGPCPTAWWIVSATSPNPPIPPASASCSTPKADRCRTRRFRCSSVAAG